MVIQFEKDILKRAIKALKPYGTKARCAEVTKVHPNTISRVLRLGEGDEETVKAITEYIEKCVA